MNRMVSDVFYFAVRQQPNAEQKNIFFIVAEKLSFRKLSIVYLKNNVIQYK